MEQRWWAPGVLPGSTPHRPSKVQGEKGFSHPPEGRADTMREEIWVFLRPGDVASTLNLGIGSNWALIYKSFKVQVNDLIYCASITYRTKIYPLTPKGHDELGSPPDFRRQYFSSSYRAVKSFEEFMHVYNNIYAILFNILLLCERNGMLLEEQIHAKGKINLARYAVFKCPKQTRRGSEGKLFSVHFFTPRQYYEVPGIPESSF